MLEVLEPSPDRVTPVCAVFGRCGGCAWQHVSYPAQLKAKSEIVADALRRIGRFDLDSPVPVTASPSAYGYRVRTRLVQEGTRLGYRMRRSHAVQVVDACPVLDPRLESILAVERDPVLAPGADPPEWEAAVGSDGSRRVQRTTAAGARVEQRVDGGQLRISHGVFAQSNGLLAGVLARTVADRASSAGRASISCVELYAGAGLFTLGLAHHFDQVWAVESHPGAVADLRFNLERAQRHNVFVHEGAVEAVLPTLGISAPDLLVVDPPRSGLTPEAMAAVQDLGASRVLYVSCDPATLARDLGALRDNGYRLNHIEAFDLFPQTPHIESLAELERG